MRLAVLALACALAGAAPAQAAELDLETLDGPTAVKLMDEGKLTSVELTRAYIARIAALNKSGPGLNAVSQLNADALKDAALLDKERMVLDPTERTAVLHQTMSEIMRRAPLAFLFMYEDTYGVSDRLEWTPRTDEQVYAWEIRLKP